MFKRYPYIHGHAPGCQYLPDYADQLRPIVKITFPTARLNFKSPSMHVNGGLKNILKDVPHRQWVFSIPKRLRIYFLFDRKLLAKLSICAW